MAHSKGMGVFCTQLGMVAATALGNIMIQASHVQHFRPGQAGDNGTGQCKLFGKVGVAQLAQVFDQIQAVCIDGVDVKQVVLHLADYTAKLGQIAAKNAVAIHAAQVHVHAFGAAE